MNRVRDIVDGRWSIVDLKRRPIVNRKSTIENSSAPGSLFRRAERYLVGGVNSPVRAFRQVGGEPIILVGGNGAKVLDHKRRAYVDFIMGWGALLLGHRHPKVVEALRRAVRRGTLVGLTHPSEVELARLIVEAVPSVEQVRFTTSGTEACMTAVRLARAHTGRAKILTFDGCYHGHGESLLARKSAGLPASSAQDTLSVPFNDRGAFETALRQHGDEVACVVIEPVAANMGVVPPEPGYLTRIRALTSRHGILLIFDEVVTGFRVGLGGAQGLFGITPDLTTFGKIIGGGLPIGALGGSKRLMQRLAPEGDVFHGGTFAGHPLSMAAGVAMLNEVISHPPYERLERRSQGLVSKLSDAACRCGVPVQVNRVASMLTLFFSDTPIRHFTQAKASHRDRFARWANALRRQGILIPPSPFEALFLSTAHTEAHLDRLLRASAVAFKTMKGSGKRQNGKGKTTRHKSKWSHQR